MPLPICAPGSFPVICRATRVFDARAIFEPAPAGGGVPLSESRSDATYRWYVLALSALTNSLVIAAPVMCLPVLFKEISIQLDLSLVQVGMLWGIGSLPNVVTYLIGGALGDRFGPKRIVIAGCLLVGVTGALRGCASDFVTLGAGIFALGFLWPQVSMNVYKTAGLWFTGSRLGLASGVLSMGMAFGFIIASLVSATYLSPWLGGWRNVLFLYGAVAAVLALPWCFMRLPPAIAGPGGSAPSVGKTLQRLVRIKQLWLLGVVGFGISGSIQGALGYLPLYLRGAGWAPATADAALATFHTMSMIFVVPIALWSDRMGSRKKVLMAAALSITAGFGLLSVADGPLIWVAVGLAGMVRDGYMAVFMTMVIETKGVGPAFMGTAIGLVFIFSALGNLIAPPLGNMLAELAPSMPFVFWSGLTAMGLVGLGLLGERDKASAYAAA